MSIGLIARPTFAGDTVNPWGTIKIESGGSKTGFEMNWLGADVSLSCAPGGVKGGVRNEFKFYNVPCGKPCTLRINVKNPAGGDTLSYSSTYKFQKASVLGERVAGYMGDFIVDITNNDIKYTNRYENDRLKEK